MKATIYTGIISIMLLPAVITEAQVADARNYNDNGAGLVINNYYDHDYFYSSRINRFHRSYVAFDYYSPVFTDAYWYDFSPYSWGISIYSGSGFGLGLSFNYPVYYDYGWNYPFFGGSYYWGYNPFYYNWYSPFSISFRIGNWWPRSYYGWYDRDRWDYGYHSSHNNYYNSYNYYNNYNRRSAYSYGTYSGNSRRSGSINDTRNVTSGSFSRRDGNYSNTSRTGSDKIKTNNGLHLGETRRFTNPSNPGGTSVNTGSRGQNNSGINSARNNRVQYNSNSSEYRRNQPNNQSDRNQRSGYTGKTSSFRPSGTKSKSISSPAGSGSSKRSESKKSSSGKGSSSSNGHRR